MIFAMDPKQRYYIRRLAIPFQHLVRSNEIVLGDAICRGFIKLEELYLISGDGIIDKKDTDKYFATISKWLKSVWTRVHREKPARANKPPALHLEFIPAHRAKHLGFNNAGSYDSSTLTTY